MPTGKPPRLTWTHLFAVRPTFTLIGLRVLWFAIAIREALFCSGILVAQLGAGGNVTATAYALAVVLLQPLLRLVMLRLLLEVAAEMLVPGAASAASTDTPETKRRDSLETLRDFFIFRPVFSATGLTIVWIGYLIFTAITYAGLIFALVNYYGLSDIASFSVLVALVTPLVWLGVVRVLVEVAGRVLPAAAVDQPKPKPRRINVLLIGAGGREHALAWKVAQSPHLSKLYAAPGNPGVAECAELVALDVADAFAVTEFCRAHTIELVVIGPETPLVAGLVDDLAAAGIAAFGPSREAARLEGSKGYAKDLAAEAGIPTAAYRRFTDRDAAHAYLRDHGVPIVVKADGLAAGKGVTVAMTVDEALAAVDACFAGTLGAAGSEVVIEDYLAGEEASFFILSDGKTVLPLATAQDHKRVGEGDSGPNTGGMGAYSPAPVMTPVMVERTLSEIIRPTLATMQARGAPFRGVLYAGLMITADGPQLIEYNVRFGDPEAQVLMMRLDSDLLELLYATARGRLAEARPSWSEDAALTVVMAAKGYPGAYATGSPIDGLDRAEALPGVKIFQAGTARRDRTLVANGGRVLNVTARGATIAEAKARAYAAVDAIDWPDGFCRRDIGWRAAAADASKMQDATPSPLGGAGQSHLKRTESQTPRLPS